MQKSADRYKGDQSSQLNPRPYYGDMDMDSRGNIYNRWMADEIKHICATSGMTSVLSTHELENRANSGYSIWSRGG